MFKLGISAWNGAFGGAAEAYVGIGGLHEIAEKLRGFPARPSDVRDVILGSLDNQYTGDGVSMRFHCIGGAGHAYVESRLHSKTAMGGTNQSVMLATRVEAAAVDSFVNDLQRLEKTGSGAAHLKGMEQGSW